MSLSAAIFILIVLIIVSAILSSAEISLAGARRIKLQTLANEGNIQAEKVLKLQEQPGRFITVVQIGLNMVAVLGGVIGEATISLHLQSFYMNTLRQNGLSQPPLGLLFHGNNNICFISRFNSETSRID